MDVGVEMALVRHVDANAKQINKIHRGYGAGYPDEVLLKWSICADEWMNGALNIHNHQYNSQNHNASKTRPGALALEEGPVTRNHAIKNKGALGKA
jgi:hypothetical protein